MRRPGPCCPVVRRHLQNDVIEPDQVLGPWAALAVVLRLLLQQGPLQTRSHALVPLDGRGQLDVGQVAGMEHMSAQVMLREVTF